MLSVVTLSQFGIAAKRPEDSLSLPGADMMYWELSRGSLVPQYIRQSLCHGPAMGLQWACNGPEEKTLQDAQYAVQVKQAQV